jgi:hypothetical protein
LSLITFAKADEAALRPAESELPNLPASGQQPEPHKKKKRGPKGPNSLSVKKKKAAVPQHTQLKPKPNPMPVGPKRKRGDEQDGVKAPAETSRAPGGGHKRKRRKMNTEPSTGHDAS